MTDTQAKKLTLRHIGIGVYAGVWKHVGKGPRGGRIVQWLVIPEEGRKPYRKIAIFERMKDACDWCDVQGYRPAEILR